MDTFLIWCSTCFIFISSLIVNGLNLASCTCDISQRLGGHCCLELIPACNPDETCRKGVSFCDILCVFTIWLHAGLDFSLCQWHPCSQMCAIINKIWGFFCMIYLITEISDLIRDELLLLKCTRPPPKLLPCCEVFCQQLLPFLSLSLTTTVRSSRWWAINADNKHSPSISVCLLLLLMLLLSTAARLLSCHLGAN